MLCNRSTPDKQQLKDIITRAPDYPDVPTMSACDLLTSDVLAQCLTWDTARDKNPKRDSQSKTQIDRQVLALFVFSRGHLGDRAASEQLQSHETKMRMSRRITQQKKTGRISVKRCFALWQHFSPVYFSLHITEKTWCPDTHTMSPRCNLPFLWTSFLKSPLYDLCCKLSLPLDGHCR